MLDHGHASSAPAFGWDGSVPAPAMPARARVAPPLRIGLLNNMPDAAFVQTERQFRQLIGHEAVLAPFVFRDLPRGPLVRAHIDAHYAPHEALAAAGLDALVVTGCEPKADRLDDEPFFGPLGMVVDWAEVNTVSTLFSCLASHAAVLHLDGIRRRPLAAKHSGVFACSAVSHPLLAGMPETVAVPHSRWNDLSESDLVAHGYTVLRRSAEIGVDLFVRESGSLFVFLQGHPEYAPDSLAREYRRDVGRFLDGSRDTCPPLPENYFSPEAVVRLDAFAAEVQARREPALFTRFPSFAAAPPHAPAWQAPAAQLFRNWIAQVALRRVVVADRCAV
ncbi:MULTISPECIES: homoserine O-succinyltransferase MetA [Methylobacterium]|uniref:Homoserine O-succinyltransferase n=1 Tax=Methylobacterium thuringiense TaxID=1003091 RepID=A0ABQ4TP79_9HYPH|nr:MULTISPECIES: homoserine O-succinyltransferase [Methylobacterium]TXN21957.1 homoserine O-succinyltransferase [Methylobacterium sp. WL9]GJE56801.1 Homoserine O-succinyltransferase [Methylobacterium thuringiense]